MPTAPSLISPSIHEYFKRLNISKLDSKDPVHAQLQKFATEYEVRGRDVEARFMQLAFDQGYICVVVGLRSCALDMFTFLGIPTVSLQLLRLVGGESMNEVSPDLTAFVEEARVTSSAKAKEDLVRLKLARSQLLDSRDANVFKRININDV